MIVSKNLLVESQAWLNTFTHRHEQRIRGAVYNHSETVSRRGIDDERDRAAMRPSRYLCQAIGRRHKRC
jgi:hypothetical protein